MAQSGSPKEIYLGKLTVTIVYLMVSFMSECFKKILTEQIMRHLVAYVLTKLGLSCLFAPKGVYFGNVEQHCFGLTTVSHHATSFQKNP